MSNAGIVRLEPVPWRPDLPGTFPGQQSYIELGSQRVRLILCWCPPTPAGQSVFIGSPEDEAQRTVVFPTGFWLARCPVNQDQWQAVMGQNPSRRGKAGVCPVDSVSWNDAQQFCKATGLRLPTEAEWEYACRAGTTTPVAVGGGVALNAQAANFDGNHPFGSGPDAFKWVYRERTLPEGSFPPNAWGFHDMHGQIWEWCEDHHSTGNRVRRGGSWIVVGGFARSAFRGALDPDARNDDFGFRPCPCSTEGARQGEGAGGARSEARDERNDGTARSRSTALKEQ